MADALGKRRVDDEMVPERLETEHRSQQQQRVPVDQACGLHAVGYCTGYSVTVRS